MSIDQLDELRQIAIRQQEMLDRLRQPLRATVSDIGEANFQALLDTENFVGPFLVETKLDSFDRRDCDSTFEDFDWTGGELQRTAPFLQRLLNALTDSPSVIRNIWRLANMTGPTIFEHSFTRGEQTSVDITGKVDAVFAVAGERLPTAVIASETFCSIELKVNLQQNTRASFLQAATELVLMSLLSRYETFQVLTDSQTWYFFRLVRIGGAPVRIEFEFVSGWVDGIARLRYLLGHYNVQENYRLKARAVVSVGAGGGSGAMGSGVGSTTSTAVTTGVAGVSAFRGVAGSSSESTGTKRHRTSNNYNIDITCSESSGDCFLGHYENNDSSSSDEFDDFYPSVDDKWKLAESIVCKLPFFAGLRAV